VPGSATATSDRAVMVMVSLNGSPLSAPGMSASENNVISGIVMVKISLVLRFSQMVQLIPMRTGRRAVSSRRAANHPSDSVH
jgi:hypothetical protein